MEDAVYVLAPLCIVVIKLSLSVISSPLAENKEILACWSDLWEHRRDHWEKKLIPGEIKVWTVMLNSCNSDHWVPCLSSGIEF